MTIAKKGRTKRWLICCSIAGAPAAFAVFANWWRVSFHHGRVIGQPEAVLVSRHGPPEYDTRVTPYQRRRPADEQERITLGLDNDTAYTLIWITGILGQNHVKVQFVDGVATGVQSSSHR
jgi:hypothetical protein